MNRIMVIIYSTQITDNVTATKSLPSPCSSSNSQPQRNELVFMFIFFLLAILTDESTLTTPMGDVKFTFWELIFEIAVSSGKQDAEKTNTNIRPNNIIWL
jgi:hypothetical protein